MSGPGSIVSIVNASPTSLLAPNSRDAEDRLVLFREEPLVLALFLFVRWIGEFVEAVGDDEAATGSKLAAVRAEIVDGIPVRPRPAPSPLHQIAGVRIAVDRAYDWRHIRDLNVLARLDVRRPFGEADLDLEVSELLENYRGLHFQSIIVAHAGLRSGLDCSEPPFLFCAQA